MKGHVGELLRIDLTSRSITTIPTSKYEKWVGGLGMGTALFWDEIDKDYLANSANTTGFEPDNVVCLMPGVLDGTLAPSGGRTEVCGVAPESYPRPLFTRSNFGGRWGAMLKFAGFDGIVIKGKANAPVWLDIRDKNVQIRDAAGLWGLNAFETQEQIWSQVTSSYGDWYGSGATPWDGRTTQRSAVVTMGKIGETLGRLACLTHDAGNCAGQGGFGGVFGSKNLKAISVIGSGSVEVADPVGMIQARQWLAKYSYDTDTAIKKSMTGSTGREFGEAPSDFGVGGAWGIAEAGRALGCFACPSCAKTGYKSSPAGLGGGEGICVEAGFYRAEDIARNGQSTVTKYIATQLLDAYGINAYEARNGLAWLVALNKRGLVGPGKKVDTDLDFTQLGTTEFVQAYLGKIYQREPGFGNTMAEGCVRAAVQWGLLEECLIDGTLPMIYNIGEVHWGDEMAWAYQSLFHSRDLNQHDISKLIDWTTGYTATFSAEKAANTLARMAAPWHDPMMANRSEEGIYSEPMARCVAWGTRHVAFWKNSAQFCDQCFPSWLNTAGENQIGASPEMEVTFLNAVTGLGWSYEDGLELGRKIWNFERAILSLQEKHRDEEYFPPFPPYNSYVHTLEPPFMQKGRYFATYQGGTLPWVWKKQNFAIDKTKLDAFKSIYYKLEGWDEKSGRPTRKTLTDAGLQDVADVLEAKGRLGAATSTSITIKSSATTTYIGKTVTLSGAVTPLGMVGKNIVVYVKKPGSSRWSYSSNRTVYNKGGSATWLYKYYFKPGMTKGTYQFKAVVAGDSEFPASSSAVLKLTLK